MALGKEPPPHRGEGTRGAVPCKFHPAQVLPRGPGTTWRTLPQPRGRASQCPRHGTPRWPQRARLPSSRPLLSPGRRATCERGGAWRSRAPAPRTKAEPAGAAKPRGHTAAGGRSAGEAPPAAQGGQHQREAPNSRGHRRATRVAQGPRGPRAQANRPALTTSLGAASARPRHLQGRGRHLPPRPVPSHIPPLEHGAAGSKATAAAQHQASLSTRPRSSSHWGARRSQVQPQAVQGFGAQPRPHLYSHPTVQLLF